MSRLFRAVRDTANEFLAAAGTCLYLLGFLAVIHTVLDKLPH